MRLELLVSTKSTREIKTGVWSQFQPVFANALSPCIGACPLSIDIPAIYNLCLRGNWRDAAIELLRYNPLPFITGRVCPQFCRTQCNRGDLDEPVSIRTVECYLGDVVLEEDLFPPVSPFSSKRVAIIGSGPAGLSAAWYLSLYGCKVTIFEEMDHPGGVLYWGIPVFRLEKLYLNKAIERLERLGVDFKVGHKVLPDELEPLKKEYDAIIAAVGLTKSRSLPIRGFEHAISGVELLRRYNRGALELKRGRAVVIGGGNVAVDAARVLVKSGCSVTVVCVEKGDEMPAIPEELEEARREGIVVKDSTAVLAIDKQDGGYVLELAPCRVVGERDGLKEVEIVGDPECLKADYVVAAVGQEAEFSWDAFSCGDVVNGPTTVAEAIAHGRNIAFLLLGLQEPLPIRKRNEVVTYDVLNTAYFDRTGGSEEIVSKDDALNEIVRCFSCGYCNGCGVCWLFCPDVAIIIDDGCLPEVDAEHCKGCGICAQECPRHVVVMEKRF